MTVNNVADVADWLQNESELAYFLDAPDDFQFRNFGGREALYFGAKPGKKIVMNALKEYPCRDELEIIDNKSKTRFGIFVKEK